MEGINHEKDSSESDISNIILIDRPSEELLKNYMNNTVKESIRFASWYDPENDRCLVVARREGVTYGFIANGPAPFIDTGKQWKIDDVIDALEGRIELDSEIEPVQKIPVESYALIPGREYPVPDEARSLRKKIKKGVERISFWKEDLSEEMKRKETWYQIPLKEGRLPVSVRWGGIVDSPVWRYE